MEDQWLSWAKRLQAMASTGQHFSSDAFDTQRYIELADIANQMLSQLGNIPLQRIEGLVTDAAKGYVTPKIDVRGALIRDNKILLVREASDKLWTLPGGFADVGFSAAENVVKEMWEEAKLRVEVTALYAVRHKAKHEYDNDARDFYKLYYICSEADKVDPVADGVETIAAKFFGLDELPELSTGRSIVKDIVAAFEFVASDDKHAFYD